MHIVSSGWSCLMESFPLTSTLAMWVKNLQTRLVHAAICLFGLQRRIRLYI